MAPTDRTIVWLASYPKSGNTWLRAFLANYLIASDVPIHINDLAQVGFGDSDWAAYEEIAGRDPNLMPIPDLLSVRGQYIRTLAANGADINLVKTHHANIRLKGHWLVPAEVTRQAVCLVRDPMDMVVSYADHWGTTLEFAARHIGLATNGIPASKRTVAQYLGNWSDHVNSWVNSKGFRTLVLRYEDLLTNPHDGFEKVVRHLGAPLDKDVLDHSIRSSSFETLSAQEAEGGFSGRGPKQEKFFRNGQAGYGREILGEDLVSKIESQHSTVMKQFRYI